jgi:hypothetical protein
MNKYALVFVCVISSLSASSLLLPKAASCKMLPISPMISPKEVLSVVKRTIPEKKMFIRNTRWILMQSDWLAVDMSCTAMALWREACSQQNAYHQKNLFLLSAKLYEQYGCLGAQKFVLQELAKRQEDLNTKQILNELVVEEDCFSKAMLRETARKK